jgi:hypothetical protein
MNAGISPSSQMARRSATIMLVSLVSPVYPSVTVALTRLVERLERLLDKLMR